MAGDSHGRLPDTQKQIDKDSDERHAIRLIILHVEFQLGRVLQYKRTLHKSIPYPQRSLAHPSHLRADIIRSRECRGEKTKDRRIRLGNGPPTEEDGWKENCERGEEYGGGDAAVALGDELE